LLKEKKKKAQRRNQLLSPSDFLSLGEAAKSRTCGLEYGQRKKNMEEIGPWGVSKKGGGGKRGGRDGV